MTMAISVSGHKVQVLNFGYILREIQEIFIYLLSLSHTADGTVIHTCLCMKKCLQLCSTCATNKVSNTLVADRNVLNFIVNAKCN